jgi:hypothetical protein
MVQQPFLKVLHIEVPIPLYSKMFNCKGIHLQIPEWKGQKITASIISSSGQRVTSLGSDADGTLFWDTRSVTRGVYFLQLKNDNRNLSMKLLVK